MAPSTRTPSKKQVEVLDALLVLQQQSGVNEPIAHPTHAVLDAVRERHHGDATVVNVLNALNACVRHDWIRIQLDGTNDPRAPRGSNLVWSITPATAEALQRAHRAADPTNKEGNVDTTTQEPPVGSAPWDGEDEPATSPVGDPEALGELDAERDEEPALEGEVEEAEDDSPPVNEGSNQLTLAIGGPKPIESVLKILGHQQSFGSTRQFKNLERIPITAWLEIREVAAPVQDNGKVKRVHKARLTQIEFDVELDD